MKDVLLLIHDDAGQEARLQAALALTHALEGHLQCLDVSVMPFVMGDGYAAEAQVMLLDDERTREAKNRDAIEARLAKEGIAWDWTDVTGAIAPCLKDKAALSDLIVVNRDFDQSLMSDLRVAAEIVVKADKPVFAIPETAAPLDLHGCAMVCWDGSRAAVKALQAAVPLLKLARSVILFEVDDGSIQLSAAEAATYLDHHGVKSVVRRKPTAGRRAADVIFSEARNSPVDYLVMGGFGHGRFLEDVFGGVTRKMLDESPVPVFLAH